MSEVERARLHAIIEGRVQGVGFRFYVIQKAEALQLTGWVRNRWDDTVEIVAEGDRQILDKFLGDLRKGSRSSFVSNIKVNWLEASGDFQRFMVLPTA
jgi:acylphosphatase